LRMSDINVFVGPNNSGKSSILYALMLLRMSAEEKHSESQIVTTSPELDLGSYLDLIRGGDAKRTLSLSVTFDEAILKGRYGRSLDAELFDKRIDYAGCQVEFAYDETTNKVEVKAFTSTDSAGRKILSVRKLDAGKWSITGPGRSLAMSMGVSFWSFFPIVFPQRSKPAPGRVSRALTEWHYLSRGMALGFMSMLDGIKYIAPIRERIPPYGKVGTMPYSELSASGQNLMRALSTSRLTKSRNKTLMNDLNYWLNARFKVLRNVRMINVDRAGTMKALVADDRNGGRGINLAFTGCGISQLVPIIVHTVSMPESGCLLVEQPESHLHPSAQADIADLFIDNTKGNRQFVIETHSEHFILRLRRRIAEGRIEPERVAVFAVEKKRGNSVIKQLTLRSDGHFEEWPKGFFEEGYKEALAIAEAQYKE